MHERLNSPALFRKYFSVNEEPHEYYTELWLKINNILTVASTVYGLFKASAQLNLQNSYFCNVSLFFTISQCSIFLKK